MLHFSLLWTLNYNLVGHLTTQVVHNFVTLCIIAPLNSGLSASVCVDRLHLCDWLSEPSVTLSQPSPLAVVLDFLRELTPPLVQRLLYFKIAKLWFFRQLSLCFSEPSVTMSQSSPLAVVLDFLRELTPQWSKGFDISKSPSFDSFISLLFVLVRHQSQCHSHLPCWLSWISQQFFFEAMLVCGGGRITYLCFTNGWLF